MKHLLIALLLCAPMAANANGLGLIGPEWTVTEVEGVENLATPPTLTFDADGKFFGFSGCNRMMGTYDLAGNALTLGPRGTTKMMCPQDQMQTEQALHAVLDQVTGFVLDPDGTLDLRAADRVVLRAHRPAP
jgi:heat shock protein HslJ